MIRHPTKPLLSFLLAAAATAGPVARADDAAAGAQPPRVTDAVVSVVLSNGLGAWRGSGFCVGDGSWVVTCRHVVSLEMGNGKRLQARRVRVLSPWTGEGLTADVVAEDKTADLALLRLPKPGLPALPLAGEAERAGLRTAGEGESARLTIAGCAQPVEAADPAAAITIQQRDGTLLAKRTNHDIAYLILRPTPDVGKGWSGGPLLRPESGAVVGVFHALIARKSDPGVWFPQSISTAHIEALLKQAGVQDLAPFRAPTAPAAARPADADILFAHEFRADALWVTHQWPQVETECRAILKLQPESARIHNELAIALNEEGKHEEALTEFAESLRLDPKRARTHLNYGLALQSTGKLPEAEAAVRKSTDLDPEDPEAWASLGRVLSAQKRYPEATAASRKALELAPNHPLIHWSLGMSLIQETKADEGVAELREAVALAGELKSLRMLRVGFAQLLQTLGRLDAAEAEYRAILQTADDDPTVHLLLANCLHARGKNEEALTQARRCLELKASAKVEAAARDLVKQLGG